MTKEELIEELKKININITDKQLDKLEKFYQLLIEKNKFLNLTRITEKEEVYLKHFYDSLTITKVIDLTKIDTLCDVGTGAGFPGIVLKIIFPHLKVTLIDSLNKRIIYLNEIIEKLNLKDIEAIHVRAEDHNKKYDFVTARAVANIEKLVKYTMHLVKKDKVFVAMKGNISEELTEEVKNNLLLKYEILEKKEFKLPIENSNRCLVVLKNK